MKNREIYLYGGSGHGKVVNDIAKRCNINVLAFVDDNPKSTTLLSIPLIKAGQLKDLAKKRFIISIGDNEVRERISKILTKISQPLIDPSAIISDNTVMGKGSVVMPLAVVNSGTSIGEHVIINTGVVVEHDCKINNFVHLSPNSTITGGVSIGEGTHVGSGAVVLPGIEIGKKVTVGAGSVIIKNVPDYAVIVGNPGRVIKFKDKE